MTLAMEEVPRKVTTRALGPHISRQLESWVGSRRYSQWVQPYSAMAPARVVVLAPSSGCSGAALRVALGVLGTDVEVGV